MGRLSAIVLPMGKDDKKEELSPEPEGEEDGLRETFDEFMSAEDDDAKFEALKSFIEQCCAKMDY